MSQLTIPSTIKELREELGFTPAELADALGITASAVRSYERGVRVPNGASLALMVLLAPTLALEVRLIASMAIHAREARELVTPEPSQMDEKGGMSYSELEEDLRARHAQERPSEGPRSGPRPMRQKAGGPIEVKEGGRWVEWTPRMEVSS